MGVDLYFYMRAWNENGSEIDLTKYVNFIGEDNSVYSVHNKYVGREFMLNSDYAYQKITKSDLNVQIREEISKYCEFSLQKSEYERLFLLQEGEDLYLVNSQEVIKKKWLLKHVDGYILRDDYDYNEYDEYGLKENFISEWFLEDEVDPEDRFYIKVKFDVVDQITIQRAEFVKEYLRIVSVLKEHADLDESSIKLYMYYNF